MISKFHLFAGLLAGVLISAAARAQVRDAASSVREASPPAAVRQQAARAPANAAGGGVKAPPASQHSHGMHVSPVGRVIAGVDPAGNSFDFDSTSGVPGLGFDFPHLAAISRGRNNNASGHLGHDGSRGQGSFVPILFGGYPYYPYYYDDLGSDQTEQPPEQPAEQRAQPQPQIIVIQQPVASPQVADSGNYAGNQTAASPAAAPIPDIGDFILVRRDGRILFASLFSVVGKQVQYVTPDGFRRTVALSDLDAEATQQMNEARGTTVEISN